jgi:hypothetical protein
MNEQMKLTLALMQIENLICLTEDNEYSKFLYSHLIQIKTELRRQLTNLTHSIKMKK